MSRRGSGPVTIASPKSRQRVKRPQMFRVSLHNDDYTSMDFVVEVLKTIFRKSAQEAVKIMLNVHHQGVGMCGVYPSQVAETKVAAVHERARREGFPLKCSMEPE